ncbi:MAG: carbohydrate-binding domain-containing protein [Bacteroidales bacterium]|nr:carbohydrate-binding domain-containing protein [Bacteroidales bacterium]
MKRYLTVIALIFIGLSVKAQEGEYHVRIHGQENKGIVLDAPVSTVDSIYYSNGKLKARTTNNLYSFDFTEVDSLTFPFISTGSGDIVYITYNGSSVDVVNPYPSTQVIITASEGKVSITSLSSANITYSLSGNSSAGRFAIESTTTPTVVLNGVSLTNPTGKAMDLTCDAGIILEIADGTVNSLSDGSESDKKAALMCNSDLLVQGNGTLNVTSYVKHPIKVKGICTINSGNFIITSDVEDVNGLSADSTLVINGGSFDITMNGDISKGIKCDDELTINGGDITIIAAGSTILESVNNQNVPSYCSAIKCDNGININGGTFNITLPTTNHGGKGISCDGTMNISGGDFTITTNGAGAAYTVSGNTKDSYTSACLRSDGDMSITGGTFTLSSTGAGGKGINVGTTSLYSNLTIGTANGNNEDINLNVSTSGERITVTGGGWGGGDYANPKAIRVIGTLTVNSGNITVNCTQSQEGGECLESKTIVIINGGNINAYSKNDDVINAANNITINGGTIYAYSEGNDGIDSNGTMFLNGGFVVSNGSRSPEEGFDCDFNQFKITGGTHIGTGGGTSTPTSSVCTQPSIRINTMPEYAIQILDASGNVICTYLCPAFSGSGGGWPGPGGGSSSMVMLFTDPQLQTGQTYTVKYHGTISGGTEWNGYYTGNVTYSGGDTATVTLNSMYSQVNAGSSGGGW